MTAAVVGGLGSMGWKTASRDVDGHRNFTLSTKVKTTSSLDGPKIVMDLLDTLVPIGSPWYIGNDQDAWAFCHPEMQVTPIAAVERPNYFWQVDQSFSTRPLQRCQDTTIENPLLEPPDISGGFTRKTKAIVKDRHGNPLETASHEILTGPEVLFNDSKQFVHIEQNIAILALDELAEYKDTVNDRELWGFAARCVLLSGISWRRLLYGICTFYYRRILDFELDHDTHDREAANYGAMVRDGKWNHPEKPPKWIPNTDAPSNDLNSFIRAIDKNGNPRRVYLDTEGDPIWEVGTGTGTGTGALAINYINIEHYPEKNFMLLNVPGVLEL